MIENDKFVLLEDGKAVCIVLSEREQEAVRIAADHLAEDIRNVCGCLVLRKGDRELLPKDVPIIRISTINQENVLCSAVPEEPETALLYDEKGEKRWEAYLHQVIGNELYIVGSDRRGTVFGIYELSEQMGVSPWYDMADVPPKGKESFSLPLDYKKVDWPSVQYRGIFLNDEEELEAWSKLHTKDDTIGPETYQKIFELILRLKGNYIWPAMHVNCFNANPANGELAERMGVVVGTSHCDMLLRSNQNEWQPWIQEKGYTQAKYDYSIPGRNREIIQEYWSESVEMNRDYEVCYTVGMRGIHDSGFTTEEIDREELPEGEKEKKKIALLEKVISDQKQILSSILGEKSAEKAVKLFIPYKEVLSLYDGGLKVPEDVTMMWVDDNFGYMRRYPSQAEQKRKGGNGLYYHSSYWAYPGMSYLFINSIPLAHTGNELKKCYESGIRKVWVLNIGALKPLEQDMEFFIRYGWEAGKENTETADASVFTENWINRNFSGNFGAEAADIYGQFAQLTNACKLEHMRLDTFSQTAYGNEALKRLEILKSLFDRGNTVYWKLPEAERDAFYELFLMKLHASYYINASFYYADRSRLAYYRGAMQSADAYVALSSVFDDRKRKMLYYYNHRLKDGKWNGILTPESFSPPPTVLYPAGKPALVIKEPKLGAAFPENGFHFSYYGKREGVIDLFNQGCGSVSFGVDYPEWLELDKGNGKIKTECTIHIRISQEAEQRVFREGRTGTITIKGNQGECYSIPVQISENRVQVSEGIQKCFVEAEGVVSIPADQYSSNIATEYGEWRTIWRIGRGWGNGVQSSIRHDVELLPATREYPSLEYTFFLESRGAFLLEVYRFLTLNPTGQIRFAVSVDDHSPIIVESDTTDEWRGIWKDAVMENGERLYVRLPYLEPGIHRMKVSAIDHYVTMTKFVIYTGDREKSNFGPMASICYGQCEGQTPERRDYPTIWEPLPHDIDTDMGEAERKIYQNVPEYLPLLPMLYADQEFWNINRLYIRSDEKEQEYLNSAKYITDVNGKKNVFAEFGSGFFMESDGVLAIEAEYALENSQNAYLTPALFDDTLNWTHTQAETDGKTGLAMLIEEKGLLWENPRLAPGMNYRIMIEHPGIYDIWLLVKFEDIETDACVLALDGDIQDAGQQYSGGTLFTYSMKQRWNWQAVSAMKMTYGMHTFSILGRKSGLRIDRIYITSGKELPPIDVQWVGSQRVDQ